MYLKNLKKKYQEKWENAYLIVKNARTSRSLRRALDPGHYWLTSLARLHFATSAKSGEIFLVPPWPNAGSASDIPGTRINLDMLSSLSISTRVSSVFSSQKRIFLQYFSWYEGIPHSLNIIMGMTNAQTYALWFCENATTENYFWHGSRIEK